MRTFAQKQNQPQKAVSSDVARSHTATSGLHHRGDLILHLQHAIGNQAVLRMLQTHGEELKAGLTGTASLHFGHDFSRIPIHPPAAGAIQTKLAIDKPGEEYEQEADRVAEQVMRMPEPRPQRACPCGGGCPKCRNDQGSHKQMQTKPIQGRGAGEATVPPIIQEIISSPGQPLDPTTREFMESRFGHDFSQVRVHTDARAAESARALDAVAYTVGHDVVFESGRYNANTSRGQRLLAHELAHVAQQTGRSPSFAAVSNSMTMSVPGDVADREADRVAEVPMGGDRVAITPTALMVQRDLLFDRPSAEVPGLSQNTVRLAHEAIARGDKQQAIDVIVDEMVRSGQIDSTKLLGGRVHYEPGLGGEGATTRRGFRRDTRTAELTALRRPVRIGNDAYRNVPWLYSSILHEYQHVLQLERPSGLPIIQSVVPGQQSAKLYRMQRDVEAYATEILHAQETGVDRHPPDVRDLWERLHDAWSYLDPAKKQPLKDLYSQAHTRAESIPGVGLLTHFTPTP